MATATFSATMFSRKNDDSGNYLTNRAAQGAYAGNSKMVGIINFTGLNMSNKVITGITFITTCTSEAGAGNGSTKTLYFKKCTALNPTTSSSGNGSAFVGAALGTITGTNFYNASNISRQVEGGSELFINLKAHFESGAHSLVIYAPDAVPSSSYSKNYLYLNGLKVTITYEEGLVYYGANGAWNKCQVFWLVDGAWVQCIPFYGNNGTWNQCGG